MGAQKPGNDNYKAMPALLWHCIKEAKARCNTYFDLEGSMDPGVERFFRGFGGNRELYLVLQKNDSLLWKLKQMLR
jgi:lipid II:glycine glycyltransferase (peptidoglycan interpeptide bridge formation enzyme)